MNTSTVHQELGRRFDLFEHGIMAKLDRLAELQYMPPGAGSVGVVPWIFLTVLITVNAICWLVVWLEPTVR
jgi:hypothetical protein